MNHTLSLNSTTPDAARKNMLYRVTCSCGWKVNADVAAVTARATHAEHLQRVAGPDRKGEKS
jgi:hypothetical protein